jgi:Carboxypeptidase regulatory-like domain
MFAKASRIPLLVLTMLLLPLFAGAAAGDKGAPGGNGSVSGTVKDAAGAVLQGAQVVLQPTATSVASDAQGNFVVPNIAPGTYEVDVHENVRALGVAHTSSGAKTGMLVPPLHSLYVAAANGGKQAAMLVYSTR